MEYWSFIQNILLIFAFVWDSKKSFFCQNSCLLKKCSYLQYLRNVPISFLRKTIKIRVYISIGEGKSNTAHKKLCFFIGNWIVDELRVFVCRISLTCELRKVDILRYFHVKYCIMYSGNSFSRMDGWIVCKIASYFTLFFICHQ